MPNNRQTRDRCILLARVVLTVAYLYHHKHWYCRGSRLQCDNQQTDLDEHISTALYTIGVFDQNVLQSGIVIDWLCYMYTHQGHFANIPLHQAPPSDTFKRAVTFECYTPQIFIYCPSSSNYSLFPPPSLSLSSPDGTRRRRSLTESLSLGCPFSRAKWSIFNRNWVYSWVVAMSWRDRHTWICPARHYQCWIMKYSCACVSCLCMCVCCLWCVCACVCPSSSTHHWRNSVLSLHGGTCKHR